MRLTLSAAGPAAPGEVWDRFVRPARWSQWSPQIRSVDYPDEVITTGGTGTVYGPCGLPVRFEVLEVDGGNRFWSWAVTPAMVRLTLHHRVVARGSGTLTELVVDGPAPVPLLYAPVARLAMRQLVR